MPWEVPYDQDQTEFKGGLQIRSSIHFRYTEEGGTLDAAAIGARYCPVGLPFVRNDTTGRYDPFVAATHTNATTGVLNAGFSDPVICDVDFDCDGVHNIVVGALLSHASVYAAKLPPEVTAAFKAITPNIRYTVRG